MFVSRNSNVSGLFKIVLFLYIDNCYVVCCVNCYGWVVIYVGDFILVIYNFSVLFVEKVI